MLFHDEDENANDDVAKKPAKLCDQKETLEEKWPDLPQQEDQSIHAEAQKPENIRMLELPMYHILHPF